MNDWVETLFRIGDRFRRLKRHRESRRLKRHRSREIRRHTRRHIERLETGFTF
jgi:hypothetical protein